MSIDDQEKEQSLIERYKLTDEDEDTKNWKCLLDFESPVQVESDWYSMQTFQVFLDALDINQPSTLGRDNSASCNKSIPKCTEEDDKSKTRAIDDDSKKKQSNDIEFETILSAEALKILSELPDLSHMSHTRSFMFPDLTRSSKSSRTMKGKR